MLPEVPAVEIFQLWEPQQSQPCDTKPAPYPIPTFHGVTTRLTAQSTGIAATATAALWDPLWTFF